MWKQLKCPSINEWILSDVSKMGEQREMNYIVNNKIIISVNINIKKKEISQINNPTLQLMELEKKNKLSPKLAEGK